jgi:hypothetical protein
MPPVLGETLDGGGFGLAFRAPPGPLRFPQPPLRMMGLLTRFVPPERRLPQPAYRGLARPKTVKNAALTTPTLVIVFIILLSFFLSWVDGSIPESINFISQESRVVVQFSFQIFSKEA